MDIYVIRNNQKFGPYNEQVLLSYVEDGQILKCDKAIAVGDNHEKTVAYYLKKAGLKIKLRKNGDLFTYNKWLKADLIAIDDIMLFPVKKEESASFFNLINSLHEKTSVIITTNKSPTEWVETLNDEVLATAILDRMLYRCEVVKLAGSSYRLENRKTIFKKKKEND